MALLDVKEHGRLTRCRTGCLKCRVRRRKCDEKRPRCRNCIDKDLDCHYGPRLSFLEKNAITVAEPQMPSPASTSGYSDIRFVNEHPKRSIEDGMRDKSPSQLSNLSDNQPDDAFNGSITPDANVAPGMESGMRDSETTDVDTWMKKPELDPSGYPQGYFDAGDESAVRGLVALGAASPERAAIFESLDCSDGRHVSNDTPCAVVSHPGISFNKNGDIHSQTQILQLLRHYRYNIAPWLDIFDLQQSFGIRALQVATVSEMAMSAILSLSQSSLSLLHKEESAPNFVNTGLVGFLGNVPRDQVEKDTGNALVNVIGNVQTFMSNISRAWDHPPEVDPVFLENLTAHASETSLSAIAWLLLRLDLSAALAGDTGIRVPIPVTLATRPSEIAQTEDLFGRVFHYSTYALFLCAKALQWRNDEGNPPHIRMVEYWVQIIGELNEWYHSRPQEFQPMLELGTQDATLGGNFPMVLFSNGAGVFGNQLYHTAMLLLIQDKPRTARLVDYQPATMSPLWHAKQICSIALNNDRRECWDLSLLASFLVAARRMTHESQHREILDGFDRIISLTGWDITESLRPLREEWCSV